VFLGVVSRDISPANLERFFAALSAICWMARSGEISPIIASEDVRDARPSIVRRDDMRN